MSRYSQEDAFPVIARLIRELSAGHDSFVAHRELVDALLRDSEGEKLIAAASAYPENEWSSHKWASNMVQWFSQKITQQASDYYKEVEREERADGYAYRSKAPAS